MVDLGQAPPQGTIALIVVTAFIVVLMNAYGKALLEWVLNVFLAPVRFVKETVYRWIAPRNPLSISLRSYKKHVGRSNLTRMENPIIPHLGVPLEHAFAPLKLISSATQESVDLFALAAASRRCIVLGGPGTGKTTLMKSLVTGILKGRAKEKELGDLIPVFVVLRNLAKKEHTVQQAIVAAFETYHFPGADKFVESALSQGKMLVVLDGLDEVGASREYVAQQILDFCEHDEQRGRSNRLFVTCRENSYRTKDLQSAIPEVVRVEPFANHHMRVFLEGWPTYKGRSAVRLYGLIQNDPQIRDICRNPLLLTILTGLYLDNEKFELPTSRDRFYEDAVAELLVHRPARRLTKQTYEAETKRQILERVALDRLETATPHEDPEEFTREAIREKGAVLLREEKFDPRELIKEMVEINGIIKPGSEGSYTCAHRTIQEFFAAREARRTRRTEDVIAHFGSRPEMIEVLYFYCGMQENIPALTSVVTAFVAEERWLEAGRCIMHMKEPPARTLVEHVATELHRLVTPSVEFKPVLEVLSSLAQRPEPEFDTARRLFADAVDRLSEGHGASGASALESALATSPEAAMKVIPSLLEHESERWKTAAVHLLRDIGTDEALDQLVQLLNDEDPFVKSEAARTLAGMVETRPRDLKARAILLPPRTDASVWPLEQYFPSNLAIPIAESLPPPFDGKTNAIHCAARAIHLTRDLQPHHGDGNEAANERSFLKNWRRLPRHLAIRRWKQNAAVALALSGYALAVAIILFIVALHIWSYFADRCVVLSLTPLRVSAVERKLLDSVNAQAKQIVANVELRFPPNASGLSRIFPWNWSVEPILPDGKDAPFEAVRELSLETVRDDPYLMDEKMNRASNLSGVVPDTEIDALRNSVEALGQQLPAVETGRYAFVRPSLVIVFILVFTVLFTSAVLYGERERISPAHSIVLDTSLGSDAKRRFLSRLRGIEIGGFSYNLPYAAFMFPLVISIVSVLLVLIVLGCLLAGLLLQAISWPQNPLLPAVAGLVSPQTTEEGKKPTSPEEED